MSTLYYICVCVFIYVFFWKANCYIWEHNVNIWWIEMRKMCPVVCWMNNFKLQLPFSGWLNCFKWILKSHWLRTVLCHLLVFDSCDWPLSLKPSNVSTSSFITSLNIHLNKFTYLEDGGSTIFRKVRTFNHYML